MRKTTNKILQSFMVAACCSLISPIMLRAEIVHLNVSAQEQERTLKGVVLDDMGLPLPGAAVMIKGTSIGVTTDIDGVFTLKVPATAKMLSVSFIGFTTQDVLIENKTSFNIKLASAAIGLDEVVAIGYGTQRKADVTSAVSSVKSEDFVKGAVQDAGQLVQGKVAGLNISLPTGDPTESTKIMLRGTSSLKGGTNPLILVDGVPGNFSTVAPEDIESIDVLKDGSATAIYGTRGTNGVIIITTKRSNKDMPSTIEYSGYVSVAQISRRPDFMDAGDLRQRWAEGYTFTGANDQDYGADTDWLDEITRTGISHVHNLTFRGGNKQTSLTASLNYRDFQGAFMKSDYKSIQGRIEVNHSMFDNRLNAAISTIVSENEYWAGGDGYSFNSYVYRQAQIHNPTQPVKDAAGDWVERDVYFYDNPVGYIQETDGLNRQRNVRFTGSLEFRPIDELSIKGMFTRKGNSQMRGFYQTKKHVSTVEGGKNGYASRGSKDNISNLAEFTVDFKKSFGDHRLTALVGYNYEDNTYDEAWMNNYDFPTDNFSYNNMGSGLALKKGFAGMGGQKTSDKLIGVFARLGYNYADKYMLMFSVRREGSSKFGANHKWGTFPGISAGWRINQESFMEDVKWVDNLKLRAGFGITGINIDRPYQSLSSMNYLGGFLYNGEWIKALRPVRNPNPDLRWEKKHEYNVGLDWDLLEGRIGGAIDYYTRVTKDALWDYSVPTPPYLYSSIMANVGEIKNSGLEILINAVPVRTKNFEWSTNISYSTNKNKLVSLQNEKFQMTNDWFEDGATGEPIQTSTHIVKIGDPIGNLYGLKSVDITEDGKWIVENEKGEHILASDANNADRQVLGNGVPKHYLNWNNTIRYKGFDLNISMRGAFGFQLLNFQRMYYENPGIQYNVLNSAFDKVYGKAVLNDDQRYVSYYVEDGDYWKIDNVTLGYSFNMKAVTFIKSLRIYASALNLATITGYKGMDPEVDPTGLHPGSDNRDKYPTTRKFTFGLNVTF